MWTEFRNPETIINPYISSEYKRNTLVGKVMPPIFQYLLRAVIEQVQLDS